MITIQEIQARQVLDSLGYPTLAGTLRLSNNQTVHASIPSTFSSGKRSAFELRDGVKENFDGLEVKKAVSYINTLISPKLKNISAEKQKEVDYWLIKADSTDNKSTLGGNTILLVSTLIAKAAAVSLNLPLYRYLNQLYNNLFKENLTITSLPTPVINVIDGGRHAKTVDFQEYYVFFPQNYSLNQVLNNFFFLRKNLEKALSMRAVGMSVGSFGGYAPSFNSNLDAYEIINESLLSFEKINGIDIFLGTDFSADNFFINDVYQLRDISQPLSKDKYYEFLLKIMKNYHLIYIEDPFAINDLSHWNKLYQEKNQEVYITADYYSSGGKKYLIDILKNKIANCINIKPSYYGTVTETLEMINIAKKNNLTITIGSKTGDTEDTFIADLSVAVQANFVKFGSLNRAERIVKYNRLLKIEEEMVKSS